MDSGEGRGDAGPGRVPSIGNRTLLVWCVVLGVFGAIGAATTEFHMGVPPEAAGVAALAGVLLAVGALAAVLDARGTAASPRGARWLLVALLLIFGVLAAQEAWKPGYVRGHDVRYHAWAYYASFRSVLDGDLWPRWNPYLAFGLPLFHFYAPGPYVLAWPVQALGWPPDRALSFVLALCQAVSALSAYASVRALGGSRVGGAVGAAAIVLFPYHLMDQNFRLAMGEVVAFPLLPPLLASVWAVGRTQRRAPFWVFVICLAALVLSHVLSVLTAALACVPIALLVLAKSRRRDLALKRWVGATTLALALTAFFWVPMAVEAKHTALDDVVRPNHRLSPWAAMPGEAFQRRLWPRYGIRYPRGEKADPGRSMPMYVGVTWIAALCLAGWSLRRRKGTGALGPEDGGEAGDAEARTGRGTEELAPDAGPPWVWDDRPAAPFVLSAVVLALLATWPFAVVLDGTYVLGRIQFPWRLYLPLGAAMALAAGLAADRLFPRPGRARTAAAMLLLSAFVIDAWPYLGAADRMDAGFGEGATYLRGGAVERLDLPVGEFVRVEELALPPGDYHHRVGMVRMMFPEYMRPDLRRTFGRRREDPGDERLAAMGVSVRVGEDGGAARRLDPAPFVTGPGNPTLQRGPEWIDIELEAGHRGGRVALLESWFPGWRVRIDSGPEGPADSAGDLLIADVPAGSRRVSFRFSPWFPVDRAVGRVLSFAGILVVILLLWRRR